MNVIEGILQKDGLARQDIILLLQANAEERNKLYAKAAEVKEKYVGRKVYFRGLIEMSNICSKNCFYCGIRAGNFNTHRYNLSDDEVVEAARYAWENKYASLAIQTGEVSNRAFTERISNLLNRIHSETNGELGITLSMGEQTEETYKKWFECGASRYLLRIESTNRDLYAKLHPNNKAHDFDKRVECLNALKRVGYQVGTGVMIGLPFQTIENLADDLLWIQKMDIDMVGMGPYIEHPDTPLYKFKDMLLPMEERFNLALKMIAILRILMKDINIAAPTALQAIDKLGREKGIKVGANVVMPNITPGLYRNDYKLYDNKPCVDDAVDDCKNCLEARIQLTGDTIGYGEQGNSKHYANRMSKG
ncbi:MAG: [FeFe] hydrogenase H-cluster radical SAM maturase HydE [Tenuifilaceae bacterium]|jgi:biotin synthase|nr:[FeFe] hydrogenase H-cluster radical SAM maturase HydE [Tenuifilaceae bacterium]